jgi:protein gp37
MPNEGDPHVAEKTTIEWCDSTFNPFIGCTKVSPGCENCYAEKLMDHRMHKVVWGAGQQRVRTSAANWRKPLQWERHAAAFQAEHGRRQRVFCASLADVFDNQVPIAWLADFLDLCRLTQNLDKLLLTKRIGNVKPRLAAALEYASGVMLNPRLAYWIVNWLDGDHPPADCWLGATVVNQEEADRDIPKLLATPARVRFLSIEPMLGPVDLTRLPHDGDGAGDALAGEAWIEHWLDDAGTRRERRRAGSFGRIDWVIAGGESGPGARPMHPDWSRSLRDQCAAAGVPFLFKQWGEWLPGQSETHPYIMEMNGAPRSIAHHQDGRWGETDTKITDRNYVTWDPNGTMHAGPVNGWRAAAWAERVGKKASGRLLDGVEHNGFYDGVGR